MLNQGPWGTERVLMGKDRVIKLPQTGGCQCGKLLYEITEANAALTATAQIISG